MANKPEGAAVVAVGEGLAGDVGVTVALAVRAGVDTFVGEAATCPPLPHPAVTITAIITASAIVMGRTGCVGRSAPVTTSKIERPCVLSRVAPGGARVAWR
jgi:hypothetical protein